jgi:hypothetical protein
MNFRQQKTRKYLESIQAKNDTCPVVENNLNESRLLIGHQGEPKEEAHF